MKPTIYQQIAFIESMDGAHDATMLKAVLETLKAVKEWREAGDLCDGARLMKATAGLIAAATPLEAGVSE